MTQIRHANRKLLTTCSSRSRKPALLVRAGRFDLRLVGPWTLCGLCSTVLLAAVAVTRAENRPAPVVNRADYEAVRERGSADPDVVPAQHSPQFTRKAAQLWNMPATSRQTDAAAENKSNGLLSKLSQSFKRMTARPEPTLATSPEPTLADAPHEPVLAEPTPAPTLVISDEPAEMQPAMVAEAELVPISAALSKTAPGSARQPTLAASSARPNVVTVAPDAGSHSASTVLVVSDRTDQVAETTIITDDASEGSPSTESNGIPAALLPQQVIVRQAPMPQTLQLHEFEESRRSQTAIAQSDYDEAGQSIVEMTARTEEIAINHALGLSQFINTRTGAVSRQLQENTPIDLVGRTPQLEATVEADVVRETPDNELAELGSMFSVSRETFAPAVQEVAQDRPTPAHKYESVVSRDAELVQGPAAIDGRTLPANGMRVDASANRPLVHGQTGKSAPTESGPTFNVGDLSKNEQALPVFVADEPETTESVPAEPALVETAPAIEVQPLIAAVPIAPVNVAARVPAKVAAKEDTVVSSTIEMESSSRLEIRPEIVAKPVEEAIRKDESRIVQTQEPTELVISDGETRSRTATLAELARSISTVTAEFAREPVNEPAPEQVAERVTDNRIGGFFTAEATVPSAQELADTQADLLDGTPPSQRELKPIAITRILPENPHRLSRFVRNGRRLSRLSEVLSSDNRDAPENALASDLSRFLNGTGGRAVLKSATVAAQITAADEDPISLLARASRETDDDGTTYLVERDAVVIDHQPALIQAAPHIAMLERRRQQEGDPQRRPIDELLQERQAEESGANRVDPNYQAEFRAMTDVKTDIATDGGELPMDYATETFAAAGEVIHSMGFSRSEVESMVFWEASALAHRPLYFEEVNLERHGFSIGMMQPALSAAHFFARVPALPYLAYAERHKESRYVLGHYRPGSDAPYQLYVPPFSVRGSMAETIAVIGLMYAIP